MLSSCFSYLCSASASLLLVSLPVQQQTRKYGTTRVHVCGDPLNEAESCLFRTTAGGLCRGLRALGKGPKALGKGFAERRPRQRALGKKFNGKEALCRGPFVGHSVNPFPSANGDTRQRKAAVNGAAPLTAPLPSADS